MIALNTHTSTKFAIQKQLALILGYDCCRYDYSKPL